MPREQPPQFLEHDRVEKGFGDRVETGVVVPALNRTTREYFPIVWILTGPRAGQREYTSKGWRALLDYDGPSNLACRCRECERTFRAPDHQNFCRTCRGLATERPAHEHEGYLGSEAHKTAHHSRRG